MVVEMIRSRMNDRGQMTIFIIVGILIVVGVVLAFLLFGDYEITGGKDLSPRQFVSKCVREAVEPSVSAVLAGGGRVNTTFYKMYGGEKHNYLCYRQGLYLPCINTHSILKRLVEQEIELDSMGRVQSCFDSLERDFENKGYAISGGALNYSIDLVPGKVLIQVGKDVAISREGDSESFSDFDSSLISPLYDLIMVAREITSQESRFCNFEYNGFMMLYPRFDIRRIDHDDDKIYKLFERQSGKEFKFAVRGCVLPAGG
jgi:hypothetical protein